MKARSREQVILLSHIPNIGPAMVRDFGVLGIVKPSQLKGRDPLKLYKKLCAVTSLRHDPCVLDVFMAAVDFMNGAPSRPWFFYTPERKRKYKKV